VTEDRKTRDGYCETYTDGLAVALWGDRESAGRD
jgi:hypothetical protein